MPILRIIVTSLIIASAVALGRASAELLTTAEAMAAPHAPIVTVRDTVSSLGPLASEPAQVTLADLVRYHGHPCDGLIAAAAGVAYGLQQLFPEGVVDCTDLAAAVNGSACYGDVVAYLTGTRHRYGSMTVDPRLGIRGSCTAAPRVTPSVWISDPGSSLLSCPGSRPGCAQLNARPI